jgi:hypothetical protein
MQSDHPRFIDLRITAAPEVGFIAWQNGEPLAAFTSRYEVAQWLELRLGQVPGEIEREARDFEATRDAMATAGDSMPNVVRHPRTQPKRRSLFGS